MHGLLRGGALDARAYAWAVAASVMLGACSGSPREVAPGPAQDSAGRRLVDLDGTACPGEIPAVDGLRAVEDPELLRAALGKADKGQLCGGQVFEVTRPIKVHRVWERAKAYTELGRWWSFVEPKGPVADFRRVYCDCPEWSALDTHSVCKLKVGAHVVLGSGQSATCADGSHFEASSELQVYVPNDARAGRVFVEACEGPSTWP